LLRRPAIVALGLMLVVASTTSASAEEKVVCPPGGTVCYVVVDTPGSPGTQPVTHNDGAAPVCRTPVTGTAVDCFDPVFGWWSNADGCYYERLDPPPPATDPVWAGHYPDGAVYQSTCLEVIGSGGGWDWRPTSPPGFGAGAGVLARLADEAIARLSLSGPDIGLAPDPSKTGLVGLPVWMWTRVAPSTWGPLSATASLPGVSVTATARATRIVWDMGDGQRVTCEGPGTPYTRGEGQTRSPTCGYVYSRSSAGEPDETYAVTATTTWDVQWNGSGGSGQVTQTRTSSVRVRIGEMQVLVS